MLSLPRRIAAETVRRPLFSYVQEPPSLASIEGSRSLVGTSSNSLVSEYEGSFAALVGPGGAVSFAGGRMAFFALMRALEIGQGDEVILPGYTCSVMANAVLRVGATPVFSDIETTTLGSDPGGIEHSLSSRTRMIVAQHSFGYACEISLIKAIAQAAQVFLLEDCATSLGTTVDGVRVGDFGDASIFSTDHTKPINTLIGGLIYSRNSDLIARIRTDSENSPELPIAKQQAILNRLLVESSYSPPSRQWRLKARDTAMGPVSRMSHATTPFLDEDYLPSPGPGTYPYPARFPSFLALLGLQQTAGWPQLASRRVANLGILRDSLAKTSSGRFLPPVLTDPRQVIVPLRLAWSQPDAARIRMLIHPFTTSEGTWFMNPIVATPADPEDFGYLWGTCPAAELVGPDMVNVPVPSRQADAQQLSELLLRALPSL